MESQGKPSAWFPETMFCFTAVPSQSTPVPQRAIFVCFWLPPRRRYTYSSAHLSASIRLWGLLRVMENWGRHVPFLLSPPGTWQDLWALLALISPSIFLPSEITWGAGTLNLRESGVQQLPSSLGWQGLGRMRGDGRAMEWRRQLVLSKIY